MNQLKDRDQIFFLKKGNSLKETHSKWKNSDKFKVYKSRKMSHINTNQKKAE